MNALLLLSLLVGMAVGWWIVRGRRPRKPPYLLHQEYWVYLPGTVLPPQDEIMTQLVETKAIASQEALLFSDVRLHVALVLRSKNAHVFRPDLLEPHVEATADQLTTLSEAQSFVKVRYISEEPISNRRHLKFLPQLARIIGQMGGGTVVYDVVGERLLAIDSLKAGDPGPNVRWVAEPTGGHVTTNGLRTVGVPEIETAHVAADQRWIVCEVIEQVARDAWLAGVLPPMSTAQAFDDKFRVDLQLSREGIAAARVHRIQAV